MSGVLRLKYPPSPSDNRRLPTAGDADPPAEADAAAAAGAPAAEDRQVHAVQQHDPDAAAGAVLAGGALAGLRLVRARRPREAKPSVRLGHR